jgi:hypothetical protein
VLRVTQTRFGFPSGNCTEAALASVLGVPLEAVPSLWCGRLDVATPEEAQPADRYAALMAWLRREHGVRWEVWTLPAPVPLPVPRSAYDAGEGLGRWWDAPHFLSGPNPDGVRHMTVGLRGVVEWDPNPRRRGILSAEDVGALVPA